MDVNDVVAAVKAIYPGAARVKDYTVVNGEIATWNEAVGPQPTDAQIAAALAVRDLQNAKYAQYRALSGSYEAAKSANVAYMGTTFLADAASQQIFGQALTVYKAVGSTPDGFFATDAGGNQVPMTLDQLQGLAVAIAAQVNAAFHRWVTAQTSLAAATTIAEAQAISW